MVNRLSLIKHVWLGFNIYQWHSLFSRWDKNPWSSTSFWSKSKIVESCHGMLNCYVLSLAPFSKNLNFWGCDILSNLALIQSTKFFQWYLEFIIFKFLIKLFFLVGTVAIITDYCFFSYFYRDSRTGVFLWILRNF